PVQFWFHIILDDGQRYQQITLPQDLTKDALQRVLDAELKRFTPGAVRTIAVHTRPQTPPNPQFGQQLPQGPSFRTLQQRLSQIANVEPAPLTDGTVPASADVLFVMDPRGLDEKQVFGVDQFLMRGGTVVVSTAAFRPDLSRELSVGPANSGLDDWLKGQGLELPNGMVLDPQNVPFPVPVTRNVNGFQIPDTQLVRYPPFIDVRGAGLAQDNAPTQGLNQMTVPWAGPIVPAETLPEGLTLTRLVTTSAGSWTIAPSTLVPDFDRNASGFPPAEVAPDASAAERRLAGGPQLIGAMLEGTFTSAFKGKQSPLINPVPENAAQASDDELAGGEAEQPAQITSVLEGSPESARLILLSSATMLSDDTLNLIATVDRARFIGPLTLAENIVDWSLEDRGLLALRAQQGQFARTLVPLSDGERALWEYINYGLAILGLLIVYLLFRRHRAGVRERAQRIMATA
ncbi:MAG: Gldg family protein, partial [Pseudomonadota bacterium]